MSTLLLTAVAFTGCATARIDWASRVGNYTFDEAVVELGPPDKSATLKDGTKVAEWITQRGYARGGYVITHHGYWFDSYSLPPSPDAMLRLTFNPEGRLTEWKRYYR
ncbi:MAG: hypothetical protein AB1705_14120 [Verrucomicrobiota bacterium]